MANVVKEFSYAGQSVVALPSAARAATPDTVELRLPSRAAGVLVVLNVTAVTGAAGITVAVQGVDPTNGATWTLLSSVSITAVGATVLRVRPGITAAANQAAAEAVPPVIRIVTTHANADSATYSVAVHLAN